MIIRKLKKWYFKIYHLFKLIGIYILIIMVITPSVKADEITCSNNIYVGNIQTESNNAWVNLNGTPYIFSELQNAPKKYYFKFTNIQNLTDPEWLLAPSYYTNYRNPTISYNYDNSTKVLETNITAINGSFNRLELLINNANKNNVIGGSIYIFDNEEQLEECFPTPGPEPEPVTNPITEFTEIYTDKLEYLGNETMNNDYMLAFIGIIIGFIVLEIFLRLFHIRGGYKK